MRNGIQKRFADRFVQQRVNILRSAFVHRVAAIGSGSAVTMRPISENRIDNNP